MNKLYFGDFNLPLPVLRERVGVRAHSGGTLTFKKAQREKKRSGQKGLF
jgi:hypothetical protein